MTKRDEPRVTVRDPKGEIFEVSHRNATDLVQHSGWTFVNSNMSPEDALATQPRVKRPRDSKLEASRKLAETQAAAKSDEEPKKAEKKPKKAKKAAKVEVADEDEDDDDENIIPYDEKVAMEGELDELDALEQEEAERSGN